jgi:hypothetical protein
MIVKESIQSAAGKMKMYLIVLERETLPREPKMENGFLARNALVATAFA